MIEDRFVMDRQAQYQSICGAKNEHDIKPLHGNAMKKYHVTYKNRKILH